MGPRPVNKRSKHMVQHLRTNVFNEVGLQQQGYVCQRVHLGRVGEMPQVATNLSSWNSLFHVHNPHWRQAQHTSRGSEQTPNVVRESSEKFSRDIFVLPLGEKTTQVVQMQTQYSTQWWFKQTLVVRT